MPIVKFTNEKIEIEVKQGANLRKEAIRAGVNVYQGINGFGAAANKIVNCHGLGMCGSCAVNITGGMENCSEVHRMEKAKFKGLPVPDLACMHYIGNEEVMRLACCVTVNGDVEVETAPAFNLCGDNFFS